MESSEGLNVQISNGSISVNGTNLNLPTSQDELESLFGKHSRLEMLTHIMCIWDDLGIFARIGIYDLVIDSFGFAYNPYDAVFMPNKNFFRGSVAIDGFQLTPELSVDDLRVSKFTPISGDDFWSCESGEIGVRAVMESGVFCCIDMERSES